MALINCPECGKEISDQAMSCPGCGYPIANIYNNEGQTDMRDNSDRYYAAGHLVAVISCIVACVSSLLPFFTYHILGSEGSINLWHKSFMGLTIVGFILIIAELIELTMIS